MSACGARAVTRVDHGAGSVLVLALVMVAVGLIGLLTLVGGAVVARHRAEAAADLAALAAASHAAAAGGGRTMPAAGCRTAEAVAAAGGARLTACRELPDGTVVVEVVVEAGVPASADGRPRGLRWPARARARAGTPP